MLYHNKFFHRQDTEIPSFGQSKKLKMFNQEAVQIYYCAFCGEEYINKVNLHKHMIDDHGDEDPNPEDILRCPLCDAIFYHLDAYELHITYHSIEDMYSEKNDMADEITEFSLETVPPVMEKIENAADAESAINALGIENFLQLAIDQPVDEENLELSKDEDYSKIKPKKHKKHKKSKKSAITLDEFFNMNKDVFGDCIGFQGVEEVPSRVVAKRLKVKKEPQALRSGTKASSSKDLEKLKKQGIIVKMKSAKKPVIGTKIVKNKTRKLYEGAAPIQTNTNKVSMSNEVLTKLINQSNNEIKIVKKSAKNNISEPPTDQAILIKLPQSVSNESKDERLLSTPEKSFSENIEVECDLIPKDTPSETEEEKNYRGPDHNSDLKISKEIDDNITHANNFCKTDKISEDIITPQAVVDSNNIKCDLKLESNLLNQELHKNCESPKEDRKTPTKPEKCISNPLKTLLSVSQDITIKHVGQSNYNTNEQTPAFTKINDSNPSEDMTHDAIKEKNTEMNIDGNTKQSSLKALKHLSHIIVKPVLQTNLIEQKEINENNVSKEPHNNFDYNDSDEHSETETTEVKNSINNSEKTKDEVINRLDAMKILNKNITIKSLAQSRKSSEQDLLRYDEDEESTNTSQSTNKSPSIIVNKNVKDISQNKNYTTSKTQKPEVLANLKAASPISSPQLKMKTSNNSSKIKTAQSLTLPVKEIGTYSEENTNLRSNAVLLKNLTNITAKSVSSNVKNVDQLKMNKTTMKQHVNIARNNSTANIITKEQTNKEIEIFNIDDSDSDEEKQDEYKNQATSKTSQGQLNLPYNKSIDALKNLSKHITIKSRNKHQQVTHKKDVPQHDYIDKSEDVYESDEEYLQSKSDEKIKVGQQNSKNIVLQNTLKNLSKHLTIKSGNSSPCPSVKSQDQNTQDTNDKNMNDDEYDSDSCSSRVKITELNDECDVAVDNIDSRDNDNMFIQSPDGTFSDHDNNDKEDDQFIDIESKLVTNTLKKVHQNITPRNENSNLETLKNISKSITVKSLNEKKPQKQESPVTIKGATALPNNLNKDLSIKSRPSNQVSQDWNDESANACNTIKRPMNQLINKNISNHISAINKEVTVKTVESKTIIQEITTTVTKTIKTINQTVQQEVQSTTQSTSQKNQKMKPHQQSSNKYQGIVVRHASPICGTKIRSAMSPVRPVVGTTVRHSNLNNQLVPVRPRSNVTRPVTPRMPTVNKSVSSTPVQNLNTKVLNTPSSTMKRSVTQESSGPFSCFKKPKESLIPVSDIPTFTSDRDGGSTVHYASATHVSKTNVMNVTKTVKGNTTFTAQMKSEVSSNSQQLSKLSNVSGLKIVKTSQIKRDSNLEQNNDNSASKRTTLEAIEKLQKHGLLVKKPRLDNQDNNSAHSDEDEENFPKEENEDDDY
ncbi:putative uncharacterized protein DDB_G0267840 isoform X2 [Galleria mellonella]|nr:putative uncharacterized protein DDB_G0267840 isoform X2 [Galleria mellonella]